VTWRGSDKIIEFFDNKF